MYGCYDHDLSRVIRWHTACATLVHFKFVVVMLLARCSQPPNDNVISTDISISEASASSATGPVGDVVTDKLRTLLNIPRAELDVFSGDPSEYHTFMSVFDENIDSKIDDPQIKLIRIIRYTKGAAKAAAKNCILIGGAGGYS